jgi:hypothetical protein
MRRFLERYRDHVHVLKIDYFCFVPGILFSYGTDPPARRLAALVKALREAMKKNRGHEAMEIHAIGFSAGTVIINKAAALGARIDSAVFAGSAVWCTSPMLAYNLESGRIGRVLNYYSPFDLTFLVMGCGAFGCWRGGERLENRIWFSPHYPYFCAAMKETIRRWFDLDTPCAHTKNRPWSEEFEKTLQELARRYCRDPS